MEATTSAEAPVPVGAPSLTGLASFKNVPASHDGAGSFTFGLELSEDVEDLSYRTLRDDAFDVTGGEVTTAKRKHPPDRNDLWTIHVEPDAAGAVSITLPAGAVATPDERSRRFEESSGVVAAPKQVTFPRIAECVSNLKP